MYCRLICNFVGIELWQVSPKLYYVLKTCFSVKSFDQKNLNM